MFGYKSAREVPLRTISPDYAVGARCFSVLVVVNLLLALAAFAGCLYLWRLDGLPRELALYPAMFGAGWLATGFSFVVRVEYFTFYDHWRRPLFSIIREPAQAAECESFIRELLDRVERVEQGLPIEGEQGSNPEPILPPPEWRWFMALTTGVLLSAAVPLLRHWGDLDGLVLLLAIACPTGGLLAAWRSFARRERNRVWAVLGVVLNLLPFVIY